MAARIAESHRERLDGLVSDASVPDPVGEFFAGFVVEVQHHDDVNRLVFVDTAIGFEIGAFEGADTPRAAFIGQRGFEHAENLAELLDHRVVVVVELQIQQVVPEVVDHFFVHVDADHTSEGPFHVELRGANLLNLSGQLSRSHENLQTLCRRVKVLWVLVAASISHIPLFHGLRPR